mmetsp:Transcript_18309/g.41881  ORF Transcript_18309/g.41881 Transcript_18309/m.41881 type:complete len:429 (+) Transcript_18309:3998-5284(+)
MGRLRVEVGEGKVVVGTLGGSGDLAGPGQPQDEEVEDQAVILEDERGEMEAADEPVGVGVHHVFEGDADIVLGRHVVGDVVVDDEAEKSIEQGEVDLFVDLFEFGLYHDRTFSLVCFPDSLEVVDALAPLVGQERGRFAVGGFDPGGKESTFVRLVPQILVQIGVGDFFQGFDPIDGTEMGVHVHEFDGDLLEGAHGQQMPFDPGQRLVGIVVSLFDEPQLLPSRAVEPGAEPVLFLHPLQGQDEQFGVVFVTQGREGYGHELARFQPVDGGGVDGHRLLGGDVGPVLEIVVLPLLLRLEPQTGETSEIFLDHGLVHGAAPFDPFAIVVCDVGPPVGFGLDVAQDHIFDGSGHPGHFPGDVGLPAAESLAEVTEDDSGLVGLDPFRHHVQDIVHDLGPQLQVEMGLDTLLGNVFGKSLGVASLELSGQ